MNRTVVRDLHGYPVTPETVVEAYRQRCFPMAEGRNGRIGWYRPAERAVITWDRFRVPDSLRKTLRHQPFRLTIDRAFAAVIAACAQRNSTWISNDIETLYTDLHHRGVTHSVEAWDAHGELVGGLYGLALGSCFCGESMFHRASDASKACLVHLVEHLRRQGFTLLDCQQQSPHMERFGAYLISDEDYEQQLESCLVSPHIW
jgi:leucyl/phenylalanyl-tRNA--protein transferase